MDGTQEAVTGVTTRRAGAAVEGIPAEGPWVDDAVHTRTDTRRHLAFSGFALESDMWFPDSPLNFVKIEVI